MLPRFIGDVVTEILKYNGDAIVSLAAILTGQADNKFIDLRSDARSTAIEAVLRAVELVSDQLAKPRLGFGWLRGPGHWLESLTSETFADDRYRGALGQQKMGRHMGAQNSIFSEQVFIL